MVRECSCGGLYDHDFDRVIESKIVIETVAESVPVAVLTLAFPTQDVAPLWNLFFDNDTQSILSFEQFLKGWRPDLSGPGFLAQIERYVRAVLPPHLRCQHFTVPICFSIAASTRGGPWWMLNCPKNFSLL